MSESYTVATKAKAGLSLGAWLGVFGDEIPQDIVDELPAGRIGTLVRIGWAKRVGDDE